MKQPYFKKTLTTLFSSKHSSHTLALSTAVGVYIAFSPFPGFHTAMVFAFSWMLGLSFPLVLASSMAVNNPWTMVPVYGVGYFFGQWFLYVCDLESLYANPAWMESMNLFLAEKIGMPHISLPAFLIGGNILGIVFAVAAYPVVKYMCDRYAADETGDNA